MLRDPGYEDARGVRRQDCLQEADGQVQPERQDGARDRHPPLPAAQTRCRLPQLLRGQPQHLHCAGAL